MTRLWIRSGWCPLASCQRDGVSRIEWQTVESNRSIRRMSTDSEVSHLWAVVQEWLELLPYPPNQSKLAQRLGVSRSAVSEWKKGGSSPGATHLRALAKEMQTVFGPDAYPRLLEAVNQDQGYLPSTI